MLIVKNISISSYSVQSNSSNSNNSVQHKYAVQFYLTHWQGLHPVLPFRPRVDLGAMAIKGCSAFPKAPASLETYHHIVNAILRGGVLPLCRRAVGYIPQPQPTGQGSEQVLPLQVTVDLGVMLMKEYFTFLKVPGLEFHNQMHFSVISRTFDWREVTPPWRYRRLGCSGLVSLILCQPSWVI